jgi:hypothetical protein
MSNGFDRAFAEMMRPRLGATARDEATKLVLDGVRAGEPLGSAVSLVIESLPAAKTRRLRAWVDQLSAYHEWVGLEAAGWSIERCGGRACRSVFARVGERFIIRPPRETRQHQIGPDRDAIAAAANAGDVVFVGRRDARGQTSGTPADYVFEVVKAI